MRRSWDGYCRVLISERLARRRSGFPMFPCATSRTANVSAPSIDRPLIAAAACPPSRSCARTRRGTPPLRPASSGALSAADRRCSAPRPPLEVGELSLEVLVARRRQVRGPWAAGPTAALVAARAPGSMFKWGKPEGNVHQVGNPIIQASSLFSVTSQWLSWDQGTRQSLSNLVCFFAKRSNR